MPDCVRLHAERHKPGVTLELLHLEYLEQHPDGYRYTQFCEIYRRWLQRRGLSMRQVHHAGDTCVVDYPGKKPTIIDALTGEVLPVDMKLATELAAGRPLARTSFYIAAVPQQMGAQLYVNQ